MTDVRESLTFQAEVSDVDDDPLMIPNYLQSLADQCGPSQYGGGSGSITLWRSDLYLILGFARATEDAKNELLQAATWLSNDRALDDEARALTYSAIEAHGQAGAATLIDGRWRLCRFPWSTFPYMGGMPPRTAADHARLPRAVVVSCDDEAAVTDLEAWVNAAPDRVLRGPIEAPLPDIDLPPGLCYLVLVPNEADALDVGLDIEEHCDCTAVAVPLTLDEQAEYNRFYTYGGPEDDDTD